MKKIFALLSLILISGCATYGDDDIAFFMHAVDAGEYVISPLDSSFKLMKEEQITEESHEPGSTLSASAGETMYFFKIYNKRLYSRDVLRANMSGALKGIIIPIEFKDGQIFEPLGTVDIEGRKFAVVNPKRNNLILVSPDGKIAPVIGRRIHEGSDTITLSLAEFKPFPKDLKLVPDKETKTETDKPFIGMEIIYKGRVNGLYTIAFKDYNGSGEEPYQYTNFTQDHEIIDFANISFNLITVEPNKIYYSLIENKN